MGSYIKSAETESMNTIFKELGDTYGAALHYAMSIDLTPNILEAFLNLAAKTPQEIFSFSGAAYVSPPRSQYRKNHDNN